MNDQNAAAPDTEKPAAEPAAAGEPDEAAAKNAACAPGPKMFWALLLLGRPQPPRGNWDRPRPPGCWRCGTGLRRACAQLPRLR